MDTHTIELHQFPLQTFDKIRYSDTDTQGHVNNAVFLSYLETGRVEFLYNPTQPLADTNANFVIASLHLQFISEIRYPGIIAIGTAIEKIGNSSITIYQHLYQEKTLVASAQTVIVHVDIHTRKSKALSTQARSTMQQWLLAKEQL